MTIIPITSYTQLDPAYLYRRYTGDQQEAKALHDKLRPGQEVGPALYYERARVLFVPVRVATTCEK